MGPAFHNPFVANVLILYIGHKWVEEIILAVSKNRWFNTTKKFAELFLEPESLSRTIKKSKRAAVYFQIINLKAHSHVLDNFFQFKAV